jgi:hypothetical protein
MDESRTKAEENAQAPVISDSEIPHAQNTDGLVESSNNRWERLWPVMACGAGLFSDGYINNVSRIAYGQCCK